MEYRFRYTAGDGNVPSEWREQEHKPSVIRGYDLVKAVEIEEVLALLGLEISGASTKVIGSRRGVDKTRPDESAEDLAERRFRFSLQKLIGHFRERSPGLGQVAAI
jgi:hypothetical protein